MVALVALFVALGGTSYAALRLPDHSVGTAQLKDGAVTKGKIAKRTLGSLHGARGARGPAGQPGTNGTNGTNGVNGTDGTDGTNGTNVTSETLNVGDANCPNGGTSFTSASGTTYACNGAKGDKGDTGSQGPGGQIVTFDATASATPTKTTLGTFLGDTISADCKEPATGAASLEIFMQTTDGSWNADYTELNGSSFPSFTPFANSEDYTAGSLSSPTEVFAVNAGSGGGMKSVTVFNFVQLSPSAGSMTWHLQASTENSAETCHMSVQAFPETLTTISG